MDMIEEFIQKDLIGMKNIIILIEKIFNQEINQKTDMI